jgi:hypothetical protein
MPAIIAIANGNFSNPAIWHTGTIPQPGDTVIANGFTVTLNQSATVATLSNKTFFGLTAIPKMTGYTTPSGIASAQNEYSADYQAWEAFDGDWTDGFKHWIGRQGRVLPEWLQYEFASPKVIIGYSLQTTVYDGNRATDWQFQAWNGTDWVVLDTNVGSPSQVTPYVRMFTNTVAYSRYRIFITNSLNSSYIGIGELRMFENLLDAQNAVAGGNFILAPNVNFTCTVSIEGSNVNLLNWTGGAGTTSTITSPILHASTGGNTFQINGTGTLNINIALTTTQGGNPIIYNIVNTGTINIVGSIIPWTSSNTGGTMVIVAAAATVNITGDITQISQAAMLPITVNSGIIGIPTLTMTGNLTAGIGAYGFTINSYCIFRLTGALIAISGQGIGIYMSTTCFVEIVGPISSTGSVVGIYSLSYSSTLLVTGPFIFSPYGYNPVWAVRYFLIPTTTTYIEFRDNSTGGLGFPAAVPPTKRFIPPSASSDSPNPADVRLGVLYAFATLTGTLNIPHPNQVTYGVAVDNTFGNAVLTAASVWDYLVSNITVENSIGMRLKNVSTPQTTGEQLEAFLRLE